MRSATHLSLSLLACLAAGAAFAEASMEVPEPLRAADGEQLAMTLRARGVQVYECRAVKGSPYAYEWALVAPDAELFDAQGAHAGKHYAGPHWEAIDGSRVAGTVKARAEAPAAGAIPWLLLAAKSDGPDGVLSKVSSVQRVNTAGGVAPTGGCAEATAGTTSRVTYSADYRMYVPR
jgi:Protein of unknown function (DUF3455)